MVRVTLLQICEIPSYPSWYHSYRQQFSYQTLYFISPEVNQMKEFACGHVTVKL